MDSFESISSRLIKQPGFWMKICIGIIISIVPLVNIFSLGYLVRVIDENQNEPDIILPIWDFSRQNLKYNFLKGLHVLSLLIVFLFFPMIVAYVIGLGFTWIFSSITILLVDVAFLVGMPTSVYAMFFIKNTNELLSTRIVSSMFQMTFNTYKSLFIPTFLFLCLNILVFQIFPNIVLGGSLFFGLVFMIAFVRNLKIVYNR